MTNPNQITTGVPIITSNSPGPWLAPNGSYYALGYFDDTGATLWRAVFYKASDPSAAWSVTGGSTTQTNQPTIADGKSTGFVIDAAMIGAKIYVAYVSSASIITVKIFDTATDTWSATSATLAPSSGTWGAPAVAVNGNGDLGVSASESAQAGNLVIFVCPSASLSTLGFNSSVILKANGGTNGVGTAPKLVGGSAGRFHAVSSVSSLGTWFLNLNSAGTVGTATQLDSAGQPGSLATRNASGTIKIRGIFTSSSGGNFTWVLGDSADNLVPTTQGLGFNSSVSGVNLALAYRTADTSWYLLYDSASSNVGFRTINDAGTSVSAVTTLFASEQLQLPSTASSFTRSGTEVIGMVGDLSTTKTAYFEQPTVAAPSSLPRPPTIRLASIPRASNL